MQDLVDAAQARGVGRNITQSSIHSRRAASLFMVSRGIVGLVGRDEEADPSEYKPARPWQGRNVARPGHGLGFDNRGRLVADLRVRRSVHEQGLSLPWPMSLAQHDPATTIEVDGETMPLQLLPNGDLKIDRLRPGETIRARFSRVAGHGRLTLERRANDRFQSVEESSGGTLFPVGLPALGDRPGWVERLEELHADSVFPTIEAILGLLPRQLSDGRRLRALHALAAIGGIRRTSDHDWMLVRMPPLPDELADAFNTAARDPNAYDVLPPESRAPFAWLVRAGWLSTNVGWTAVRPNDLSKGYDIDDFSAAPQAGQDAVTLRLAEAIFAVLDWLEHPSHEDPLDVTAQFVRRCLLSIGYTELAAVTVDRESDRATAHIRGKGGGVVGRWVLLPVGSRPGADVVSAAREAAPVSWAVCSGTRIVGRLGDDEVDLVLSTPEDAERLKEALAPISRTPD
jgi:hypothetical protein